GARLAACRDRRPARGRGARSAAREVAGPRARDERRVLGRRRARDRGGAAGDVSGALRVRARRRLVSAHHRADQDRPPDPPVRALRRSPAQTPRRPVTLAEAAAHADALAEAGNERELATLRTQWDD